jgi:hypothetical protein
MIRKILEENLGKNLQDEALMELKKEIEKVLNDFSLRNKVNVYPIDHNEDYVALEKIFLSFPKEDQKNLLNLNNEEEVINYLRKMVDEGKIDSKKSREIKQIGTGFFTKMLNYYKNKDSILKERENIVKKIQNILKEF